MIYNYKTEGISPKDFSFSYYRNPIKLVKDLRDANINPKKVLKDQIKFKSDLGKIKKGNPISKSEDQISVTQNIENFFGLREKIIDFFRDGYLLLSEAEYKAKYV